MEEDFEFAVGQEVLAYSQGLLYEAKCIKRRVSNSGQNQYFIHYKGFKAKWDEWTDEDEVLEINAINLGHKKRLEIRRKSEKTKKSQEPRTTEASSSKPPPRKRGNPENDVEQQAVEQQAVEQQAVEQQAVEQPAVEQPAVEQRAVVPVVENEVIPIVEDDDEILVIDDEPMEPIIDVENDEMVRVIRAGSVARPNRGMILHNIPPPMLLANELRSLKLPRFLKGARDFDRTMHRAFGMILKFPEKNFVAEVLHEFTKSTFFVDDDVQKKYTIMFPVTLMKYFNTSVHSYLTFRNERKYRLQRKGMKHFRRRMRERPDINYVLKNHLNPRRIWCYLYGPVYLIRLLDHLPKILVTNSWHPDYDTNLFVLHVKQLMRFMEHNYDTYFSVYDYIPMDNSRRSKNVFLRLPGRRY